MTDRLSELEDRVDNLEKAFPNGDADGHRRYHELMIDDIESRKRLRQAIQEKTISALIWSAVAGAAIAAWHTVVDAVRGAH